MAEEMLNYFKIYFPKKTARFPNLPLSKFGKVAKNVLTKQLAESVQL